MCTVRTQLLGTHLIHITYTGIRRPMSLLLAFARAMIRLFLLYFLTALSGLLKTTPSIRWFNDSCSAIIPTDNTNLLANDLGAR